MSSSKFRLFEPSYIWKYQDEPRENRGILSRMLGLMSEEKPLEYKCADKYPENIKSNNEQELGSVLKIMSSKDDKFIFEWQTGTEKLKKREVSEHELPSLFAETMINCNNQFEELYLNLKKEDKDSGFWMKLCDTLKIEVRKLYLRVETLKMLEWWLQKVDSNGLNELNIAPYGNHPIDIPAKIFDFAHFQNCHTLCIMEHCSFSSKQFLSICASVPHFSFYSDYINENIVKSAIEKRVNSSKEVYFVVLEWFFARKVKIEEVIHDLVRPKRDRLERLNNQTQLFEPVEVYSVSNENNKKLSVMIVEEPSNRFQPYSLVLFS